MLHEELRRNGHHLLCSTILETGYSKRTKRKTKQKNKTKQNQKTKQKTKTKNKKQKTKKKNNNIKKEKQYKNLGLGRTAHDKIPLFIHFYYLRDYFLSFNSNQAK